MEEYQCFKMDKLMEQYPVRIPAVLKEHIEKLTPDQKKALNIQLIKTMSHAIHEANFDPSVYCSSE